MLHGGVVLTGGAAMLKGLAEMAEEVMQTVVRVGMPMGVGGMVDMVQNPSFAVASGLLLHAARRNAHASEDIAPPTKPGERKGAGKRFWETVKQWF
jgi:cell division protein FtsA